MKKPALPWQILVGLIFGLVFLEVSRSISLVFSRPNLLGTFFVYLPSIIAVFLIFVFPIRRIPVMAFIVKIKVVGCRLPVVFAVSTMMTEAFGFAMDKISASENSKWQETKVLAPSKDVGTQKTWYINANTSLQKKVGSLQPIEDVTFVNSNKAIGSRLKFLPVFFVVFLGEFKRLLGARGIKSVSAFPSEGVLRRLSPREVRMLLINFGRTVSFALNKEAVVIRF